ncbi:MAG: uncharacterized membrane protein (UPF0127 family) [Candidatus Paceibacteria bacterium]|jgi:uncharacterized membrane protein (UPF0127 family)
MHMFLKRYLTHHRVVKRLLFLILGIIGVFILLNLGEPTSKPDHRVDTMVSIAGQELKTMVSKTSYDRSIGLSEHVSLAEDEAMLFIFDKTGTYSFWMKDMAFSIDIFWLNENKEIVSMKENAHPGDYPASYKPGVTARYVLETVDGFAEEYSIQVGTNVDW